MVVVVVLELVLVVVVGSGGGHVVVLLAHLRDPLLAGNCRPSYSLLKERCTFRDICFMKPSVRWITFYCST